MLRGYARVSTAEQNSDHQIDSLRRAGVTGDELRRLPDGTPYFGQLAELAYDPDEDRVQCQRARPRAKSHGRGPRCDRGEVGPQAVVAL
jgi:hypothetical protein